MLGNRTSHAKFVRFARGKDWLIHSLGDPTPKERLVVLYGRRTGDVAFQMGAANLDIHATSDVFDRALVAATNSERITVAWQLAVVTEVYDEAILDLLKSLYDGADEVVRAAVVNAIGYRGWPESRTSLEKVATDDPRGARGGRR